MMNGSYFLGLNHGDNGIINGDQFRHFNAATTARHVGTHLDKVISLERDQRKIYIRTLIYLSYMDPTLILTNIVRTMMVDWVFYGCCRRQRLWQSIEVQAQWVEAFSWSMSSFQETEALFTVQIMNLQELLLQTMIHPLICLLSFRCVAVFCFYSCVFFLKFVTLCICVALLPEIQILFCCHMATYNI